jgi:hypothetical protein
MSLREGSKFSTSTAVTYQAAHALVGQGTEVSSPAVNFPECKPLGIPIRKEQTWSDVNVFTRDARWRSLSCSLRSRHFA